MAVTIDGSVDGGWFTGTTATITPGGTCVTGSWMIVGVMAASGSVTFSTPSGWTLLATQTTGTRTTAWYARIYNSSDTVPYTFTISAASNKHIGMVWGSGSDVIANWVIGTAQTRAASGGTFTNTAPSVTTTVDQALVVTLSAEATSATESAVSSVSNTTQYAFMAQVGSTNIETLFFGTSTKTPPGANGASSVVYPNTQASNGLAMQVAVQPVASVSGTAALSGSSGLTVTALPGMVGTASLAGSSALTAVATGSAVGTASLSGSSSLTASQWGMSARGAVALSGSSALTAHSTTAVDVWLASQPYYIAHFGGDVSYPPGQTAFAYSESALWNAGMALEVSMWQTSDGVWVVSHDNTTDTLYGTSGNVISSSTWASISGLTTVVGGYPIMRADALFAAHPGRVWFVEDKGSQDQTNWLNTFLPTYGGPANFIIKSAAASVSMPTAAKAAGYKTWGYFYDADAPNFATETPNFDLLGMDYTGTSTNWTAIRSYGKPVIAHIVPTAAAKTTAAALGANGYMASGVQQVVPQSLVAAGLSGSSTLSASAVPKVIAAVGLSGSSSLTIAGIPKVSVAVALSGSSTLTASGVPKPIITVSLSGASVLTASTASSGNSAATLSGASVLTSTVKPAVALTTSLTGASTLTASVAPQALSVAALNGVSLLAVAVLAFLTGSVQLAGSSVITASGGPLNPARDITFTATLGTRRWTGGLGTRRWAGTVGPRRWKGSIG